MIADNNQINHHSSQRATPSTTPFPPGQLQHHVHETTPLTTSRRLQQRISGSPHFTTIDIRDGYYQTRVHLQTDSNQPIVLPEGTTTAAAPSSVAGSSTTTTINVLMDDLVIMGAGANPHHNDIITAICARLATLGLEVNRSINGTEAPALTTNYNPSKQPQKFATCGNYF